MGETTASEQLTHVGPTGEAHMVDVTEKAVTVREAEAKGAVSMNSETLRLIRDNGAEKGDVLGVARVAAILAAKRVSELIPLCHALPLTGADVEFGLDEESSQLQITGRARTEGKTGVEMEALTAVTVAALTVYDMCKAVDRGMVIGDVRLTMKSGGRSGLYQAD